MQQIWSVFIGKAGEESNLNIALLIQNFHYKIFQFSLLTPSVDKSVNLNLTNVIRNKIETEFHDEKNNLDSELEDLALITFSLLIKLKGKKPAVFEIHPPSVCRLLFNIILTKLWDALERTNINHTLY